MTKSRPPDSGPRTDVPSDGSRSEEVEREYRLLLTSLLIERQRPVPPPTATPRILTHADERSRR